MRLNGVRMYTTFDEHEKHIKGSTLSLLVENRLNFGNFHHSCVENTPPSQVNVNIKK